MLLRIYFILQFFFIFFDLFWVYWLSTEFIDFLQSLLSFYWVYWLSTEFIDFLQSLLTFYIVYWLSTDFSKYFSSFLFLVDFIPIFCQLLPIFTAVNRKFLHTDFRLSSTSVKIVIFTDFYRSQKKMKLPRCLEGFAKLNFKANLHIQFQRPILH